MKPYVILNSAISLDGKIGTKNPKTKISGAEDLRRVHQLRKNMDAIMVGINTVLIDDPYLTIRKIEAEKEDNPIRVIVDSCARTPLDANVLDDDAKTIIVVSENTSVEKIRDLREKAEVIVCGGIRVDLRKLLAILYKKGVRSILLEGGSTLNYSMFNEELVDEVQLCISPIIIGGVENKGLIGGAGFNLNAFKNLVFVDSYHLGEDLIVRYKVKLD